MSYTTVLGVTPNRRPVALAELRNAHGWAPSIWSRLLGESWWRNEAGLAGLWERIEALPAWQQTPLTLTFDTGVIPWQAYEQAADEMDEFERQLPAPDGHVNHVPAMAEILRSKPECPFVGVWGTSVTGNPFDPWEQELDPDPDDPEAGWHPGSGLPLSGMYLLERHRPLAPNPGDQP